MPIDRSTLGPIEILAVAFPGSQFKGEIVPALRELVEGGVIRILDLVFVKKEIDGTVTALEVGELEGKEAADSFGSLGKRRGRAHQRRGPGRRRGRVGARQLGRPARVGGPVGGQAGDRDPRRRGRGSRARARAERSGRRGSRRARRGLTAATNRRKEARMPRFGRPGLLGTMARTAVVAGTATAVSGRVARRQQQRYMEHEQADAYQQQQYEAQQAPAPASPATAPSRPHDRAATPRRSQGTGTLVRRGVRRRQAEAAGRLAPREDAGRWRFPSAGAFASSPAPSTSPEPAGPATCSLVVSSVLGLAVLGWINTPPAAVEQALIDLIDALPDFLDGAWQLLYDGLAFWAIVARSWPPSCAGASGWHATCCLASASALVVSLVVGRLVEGSWPDLWRSLGASRAAAVLPVAAGRDRVGRHRHRLAAPQPADAPPRALAGRPRRGVGRAARRGHTNRCPGRRARGAAGRRGRAPRVRLVRRATGSDRGDDGARRAGRARVRAPRWRPPARGRVPRARGRYRREGARRQGLRP